MDPSALVSVELARHLCQASWDIGRQVGVLVDRQGQIAHVFVGDAHRIYLPEVGRARAGLGHRRGLRHIRTALGAQNGGLVRDDLTDLSKLRLDAVAVVVAGDQGAAGAIDYAYLSVRRGETHTQEEHVRSVFDLDIDFTALMASLSEEEGKRLVAHVADGRLRAALVGVYANRATSVARMAELQELAQTAGVVVDEQVVQIRRNLDAKYVVGKGKLEETVLRCLDRGCELLILDHDLSPAQARAIAAMSDLKVIDRTQLILDIFAQHAQSKDGKLQVELAQLKYNLPRLTDLDAGLSRLTGGIGGRGPGETKLEINRRRARDRITRLEREIASLSAQRGLRRGRRQRSQIPLVCIVGYTNAGKSTLMNQLSKTQVLVADQLFATLDATSRRLRFPREREAILTDTVGFIRDLPPDLMRAFRATLEELEGADLLLHVVDVSDPDREQKMACVVEILKDLGLSTIPCLTVFNKADQAPALVARALAKQHEGVAVSAATGDNLADLVATVAHKLWQNHTLADSDPWLAERRPPQLTLVSKS